MRSTKETRVHMGGTGPGTSALHSGLELCISSLRNLKQHTAEETKPHTQSSVGLYDSSSQ